MSALIWTFDSDQLSDVFAAVNGAQVFKTIEEAYPVNHLGLGNSDWTKRLKSHDVATFQTS